MLQIQPSFFQLPLSCRSLALGNGPHTGGGQGADIDNANVCTGHDGEVVGGGGVNGRGVPDGVVVAPVLALGVETIEILDTPTNSPSTSNVSSLR